MQIHDCKSTVKLPIFILVYKNNIGGDDMWYQSYGTFTNMNIFGSVLSEEAMRRRTLNRDGCDNLGDYLR